MPQIAALTINDGATTPAAHTFAVIGTTGTKATWADKVSGIPAGYVRMTHEVREAKSAAGAHSVIYGFEQPTLATVDGQQKRVRVSSAQVRFNFAQDSTDQERKDLVAFILIGIGGAVMKPATYNIEPTY
jgi:hypothetical protein